MGVGVAGATPTRAPGEVPAREAEGDGAGVAVGGAEAPASAGAEDAGALVSGVSAAGTPPVRRQTRNLYHFTSINQWYGKVQHPTGHFYIFGKKFCVPAGGTGNVTLRGRAA